jgi:hypothetical protein
VVDQPLVVEQQMERCLALNNSNGDFLALISSVSEFRQDDDLCWYLNSN